MLGQYELVLPTGSEADTVTLVGANILALERNHQLDPTEFRTWLALHECTHRLQFTAVPWLRGYFRGLVNELVESAQPEPGRLTRVAAEVAKAIRSRRPVVDDTDSLGSSHHQSNGRCCDAPRPSCRFSRVTGTW